MNVISLCLQGNISTCIMNSNEKGGKQCDKKTGIYLPPPETCFLFTLFFVPFCSFQLDFRERHSMIGLICGLLC